MSDRLREGFYAAPNRPRRLRRSDSPRLATPTRSIWPAATNAHRACCRWRWRSTVPSPSSSRETPQTPARRFLELECATPRASPSAQATLKLSALPMRIGLPTAPPSACTLAMLSHDTAPGALSQGTRHHSAQSDGVFQLDARWPQCAPRNKHLLIQPILLIGVGVMGFHLAERCFRCKMI